MTDTTINPYSLPTPAPKKSRKATIIGTLVGLVAGIIIGAASAGGSTPAPTAAPGQTVTATVEVPGPETTVTLTPEPVTPAASTACGDVREAFLTGTPEDIAKALRALVADKGADPTAREYAKYWLDRDSGDPSMQKLDEGLIQSACGTF